MPVIERHWCRPAAILGYDMLGTVYQHVSLGWHTPGLPSTCLCPLQIPLEELLDDLEALGLDEEGEQGAGDDEDMEDA
jgi:hypothetical protein